MEVISTTSYSSSLNPNAPLFIPGVYREVEDFSDQWWELVNSSAWFRDYWLEECFLDPQNDDPLRILPDDLDSVLDHAYTTTAAKPEDLEEKDYQGYNKELVSLGALKWRTSRGAAAAAMAESPKYPVKVPNKKFVNLKVNPRAIQQPR